MFIRLGGVRPPLRRIGDAVLSILATLELHGLIQLGQGSSPWRATDASCNVTESGRNFLRRLKEDAAERA
jgi:hypothetical protein